MNNQSITQIGDRLQPGPRPVAKRVTVVTGAGNLRAFVDVQIGAFVLNGCRVIQQQGQRPWASLPQTQSRDGKWYPVVSITNKAIEDAIKAEVLSAWGEKVGAEVDHG